ncbi:MAG: M48 family metallopeptidase [Alphaproteobacteria bacterium]|nr:M48 family metallopeptidase [Alphaproteobacteria bacterium]
MMGKSITAFEHIQSNNFKTILLILLFPCSLVALFYIVCFFIYVGQYQNALPMINQTVLHGMPIIIGIALVWMFISGLWGDKMMLGFAGAKQLKKTDEYKHIYLLVENTAIMAGLPTPKIYVINDDSLNAFATGYSPKNASIALTTGIMKKLSPLELQGVIAHELAHIGNRDIRLNMMLIAGVGIFGLLADGFSPIRPPQKNGVSIKTGSSSSKNKDSGFLLLLAVFITLMIFHHIIEPLLLLAVSRTREFAADATGAMITHHPQALADALKKISKDSTVEILENHKNMAQACIYAPFNAKPLFSLFSTHPSVEERIKRLEQMSGNAII